MSDSMDRIPLLTHPFFLSPSQQAAANVSRTFALYKVCRYAVTINTKDNRQLLEPLG